MPSFEHKELIKHIAQLDQVPEDAKAYASWIEAGGHLALLRENARADELALYALGEYAFIHAAVVSEESLSSLTQDDLLEWSGSPSSPCASYVHVGSPAVVSIERGIHHWGTKTLEDDLQLVFRRDTDGEQEGSRAPFEILQEYAHLTEVHWRPDQRAYCRFDRRGDVEHVVSVTSEKEDSRGVTLVSFKYEPLEQYLAASDSVLVRRFDFTLFQRETFQGWPDGPESMCNENQDFFYRQKFAGYAAYTCGVQIIRPRRPKSEILSSMSAGRTGRQEQQYVAFRACDWRHKRIAEISTDPAATANYFEAHHNTLPFETSPAFFRPEVLAKYKGDREKYTVDTRDIRCRNAWRLQRYDVNEAGQIHAYICYLRELPYEEQVYWQSFNEDPKAGISERAYRHDFKGEMVLIIDPLDEVLSVVRRWHESDSAWWKLREEALLERISTPRTGSRDEWADAFMDLAKLIVEGFEVEALHARLREASLPFSEKDKSLALLKKLLSDRHEAAEAQTLDGLREIQRIRSKVKAHPGGTNAAQLVKAVLVKYETYSAHFEAICRKVANELEEIEKLFV